ncbi:bifunctional DNA primase/polymerase [Mycolicibacter arupensis]|nr:bifunctional DNA primase/polymerase [Mycolicibacter arupensis]
MPEFDYTRSHFADIAIPLAEAGWQVFPLAPGSKFPLAGTHGHLDATDDPIILAQWAAAWPSANVGIRPQPAECVLDEDHAGELDRYRRVHRLPALPRTRQVLTRRGSHRYFHLSLSVELRARLDGVKVDIKSYNGFVVAPGSVVGGFAYRLADYAPVATLPADWLSHLTRVRRPVIVPAAGASDAGGPMPGERLVRLMLHKRPGDGRRGFLRWALGTAWRDHGGHSELIAALVAAAVSVGVDATTAAELAAWMRTQYATETTP